MRCRAESEEPPPAEEALDVSEEVQALDNSIAEMVVSDGLAGIRCSPDAYHALSELCEEGRVRSGTPSARRYDAKLRFLAGHFEDLERQAKGHRNRRRRRP